MNIIHCKVVTVCPIRGNIVECTNSIGDPIFVARGQYISERPLLHLYTQSGLVKDGQMIRRTEVVVGNSSERKLDTIAGQLRERGFEITASPSTKKEAYALQRLGYLPYLMKNGHFMISAQGSIWARLQTGIHGRG